MHFLCFHITIRIFCANQLTYTNYAKELLHFDNSTSINSILMQNVTVFDSAKFLDDLDFEQQIFEPNQLCLYRRIAILGSFQFLSIARVSRI